MKNSFFLVIPEQKNDPEHSLVFEETALRQWLIELPAANAGLSTRLIHDLIIDMNSLSLPVQKRLEALELLRHHFLIIEDDLRSRLIKSGFPKAEREQKIMSILFSLEKQITIGYWMCVRELTKRETRWFQRKSIALTIQRTIKGLSSIIISHFMMNLAVPDWIWIDLHSLYQLSVKVKKNTTKVIDENSLFGKNTICDCYKQILLLSLTNPSGLMQKEFQLIYQFIEKIVNFVDFENQAISGQKLQCIILTDEDTPPFFDREGKTQDSAMIFLNLIRLNKVVSQVSKFSSENVPRYSSIDTQNNKSDKLPAELFAYLIQQWQGQRLQGVAVFADRLDRYIAIGMEATHNLQSGLAENSASDMTEIKAETDSDRALSCYFDKPGSLSIGSLISCRKKDDSRQTRLLGIITKMILSKQHNKLIFELKVITPQSFSVTYVDIDAPPGTVPQKALLYAIKAPQGEKSFIIMESFMLKDGNIVRMFLNQENFPIILKDRKNIGLGYWQFECRRLAEKKMPSIEKKKGYDFI